MAAGAEVRGLADFRRELKNAGAAFPKELRSTHKKIADKAATGARGIALGMGGLQAKSASAIVGTATQTSASIGVTAGARNPYANVAFWGALRRTGWYAAPRYAGSTRQHAPWVGSNWEVGSFTGGPYAINRAIFFDLDDLVEDYWQMIIEIATHASHAFPDH